MPAKTFSTSHSTLPDIQGFHIERMVFVVTYITSINRGVGEANLEHSPL